MTESAPLKQTVLHDVHVSLGARLAPFGGWLMPIQYTGILQEHQAARTGAALFDTCHMGEFLVGGPTALADLERLVSCDVSPIRPGQCRYGLLCREDGGVLDDLLVYRKGDADFMIVVNAGTQDGDAEWFRKHLSPSTSFRNVSAETAKIDLQGPASPRIMQKLAGHPIRDLGFYRFADNTFQGKPVLVSRTGYTGELGFEIYFGNGELAARFWNDAMALGALPAGLGARDTLRLEMGMPLYGHELSEQRNAAESGFARAISTAKDFIGAAAVRRGGPDRLAAIDLQGRSAARAGDTVRNEAGAEIGTVTSGSFAPSLGHAIALAYVRAAESAPGTPVQVQTARQALPGAIGNVPFYQHATARRPLPDFL